MFPKKICISLFLFISIKIEIIAQNDTVIYAPYTTKAIRNNSYNIITSSINKNLSVALNERTEQKWSDVFWSMELINYKTPWIKKRIQYAIDSIQYRSTNFQRDLLELVYTNYPKYFANEVQRFITQTSHPKVFAMAAEYLLQNKSDNASIFFLKNLLQKKFSNLADNAILFSLSKRLQLKNTITANKILPHFFSKNFLPGNVVVFSFQRKNRNYPGIVIVRNEAGKFIRNSNGKIFNVPQLARSITDLPGYLTNGNTPQGIFRMFGFDVSASSFIGPTTNIQLSMPGEASLQHFMKDSSIVDSTWKEDWYKKLLPIQLKNYSPLYESFYAGMAGRTEIIAHGTAIDPDFYKNKSYYPYTPSQGCLSTKEIWSATTGIRLQSDQQKLVNAIIMAGGPDGYTVVLELDDKNRPVNINEILPFILKTESLK